MNLATLLKRQVMMSKQTNKAKHAVTKGKTKVKENTVPSCSILMGYYFIKNKAIIEETRRNEPE